MPRSARDIALVLILIGGGLLVLFSSSRSPKAGPASGIVYSIMRPVQQVLVGVQGRVSGVWSHYVDLVGVGEENRTLKREVAELRREKRALLSKEFENRRLKKLLDLKTGNEFPSLVAQVVGEDAVGWHRTLFIDRGSADGVVAGMAVTVADGVVGRVIKSARDVAHVLLLTDPGLSVDCRVSRTRARGVLSGSLDRGCLLKYISLDSDLKPGDQVVTSGLDGIFPKGLSVGTVENSRKGDQGLFLEARVIPSVNFSEIEEVLVILGRHGGFDVGPGMEGKR